MKNTNPKIKASTLKTLGLICLSIINPSIQSTTALADQFECEYSDRHIYNRTLGVNVKVTSPTLDGATCSAFAGCYNQHKNRYSVGSQNARDNCALVTNQGYLECRDTRGESVERQKVLTAVRTCISLFPVIPTDIESYSAAEYAGSAYSESHIEHGRVMPGDGHGRGDIPHGYHLENGRVVPGNSNDRR